MLVHKTVTLDRFEGKQAVFLLENGQQLILSKEEILPAAEGDIFIMQLLPEKEAILEKEELARTLLNQLLQGERHG